jgi:hypothetical protein
MLRISEAPDGVMGELIYWWEVPRFVAPDSQGEALVARMREETVAYARDRAVRMYGCAPPVHGEAAEACRAQFSQPPNWQTLLARIDSLDPWTLPDPRTLDPPLRVGLDGWSIAVETRVGSDYRTYEYWAPNAQRGPEARRAAQLAALVHSVER